MREEMARLMVKRRPRPTLTKQQAQERGRLGAEKRWAKSKKD